MSALNDILSMVPPFVAEDPLMRAYYDAVGPSLQGVMDGGVSIPQQLWVKTVTWGIDRLERIFGIIPDPSETIEDRRSKLTAQLRSGPVSTLIRLQEVAESFSGIGIDITEAPATYSLDIAIRNFLGSPSYLDAMTAAVRNITPAHLDFAITLRWLLWSELITRGDTWDSVKAGTTWAGLKAYGEAI